jgi:hypothetical protein
LVFIYSDVQWHGLALGVQPTPKDALTLRYAHIRANELRSPIQFGQATRVELAGGTANVFAGSPTCTCRTISFSKSAASSIAIHP